MKLSANVQVWIPIELLVPVESLWEKSDLKDLFSNVPKDSDRDHHADNNQPNGNSISMNGSSIDDNTKYLFEERVLIWLSFVSVIHRTTPNSLSTHNSSDSLSPASRLYLLRLGYAKLMSSLRGNNVHTATKNHPKQTELLRAFYEVQHELNQDIRTSSLPNTTNKSALLHMAR